MMIRHCQLLLVAALLVRLCASQASGWDKNQNSTSMCFWTTPRAAIIRDAVYIDGGDLFWSPTFSDGTIGSPTGDDNPEGLVYVFNFSTPFNTSSNISSLFTTIPKAPGGSANNIGPNYSDGGMFANDYEFMIYGGMVQNTDAYTAQAGDIVAVYGIYAQGAAKNTLGFLLDTLPSGITRYVTDGAAVSVPSENLGFYFGGLTSASGGPIFEISGNGSLNANTLSLTMIEANMTTQHAETWVNNTLPTTVPGRASPEIAWVPVSTKGILVAIGGVINPIYMTMSSSLNATQVAESKAQSPLFMSTVSVYDIETGVWYEQATSNAPGQLAQGCTVVASAPDGSSHNIYWYGGFDGLSLTADFSDDVWVLSVPSFIWTKVYNGTAAHARAGHRCVKPYPDQMVVIGGYTAAPGTTPPCLGGNILQTFNLSSATWIDSYSPLKWSNYTVPTAVVANIGGSKTGSATVKSPSPSGFSNATLASIFSSSYNTSRIVNWYPYAPSATTTTNTTTTLPTPVPKSGTPSYLAPVLGVVLGLIFISLVILAFVLYRRRHYLRSSRAASEAGTMDNRRWVTSWLRSTPVDVKPPPTVTTDDTPMTPYEEEVPIPNMAEMGGGQVHEMMDTSRPVELHDTNTGFTPLIANGHSSRPRIAHSPSTTSNRSASSGISGVSRSSLPAVATPNGSHRPGISPIHTPPSLEGGGVSAADRARFASGVSNVSESDRGHLRGISEGSVSVDGVAVSNDGGHPAGGNGGGGGGQMREIGRGLVSPMSPPIGATEAGDYLAAGSGSGNAGTSTPGGTRRRSNFQEGLDEAERR